MTARDGRPGTDLASLGERFAALVIDWVLCLVATYIAGWFGFTVDPAGVNLLTALLFIAYYVAMLGLGTQTLGMRALRIACISADHGGPVGLGRAFVRALLLSLLVPALTALADPYKRGLHDHASGSVVVKTRPAGAA
jgi:uncharacterized RDD family membrane protein YckC